MKLDFKFSANQIVKQNRTSEADIDKIKEWVLVSSEKYVPSEIQDELIVLFLLSCDNELELTKKTIRSYYKCRKQSPDVFDNRKMDRGDIKKALSTVRMVTIPVRTDDNFAILYFSLRDTSYSNFELLPVMKTTYMLMDVQQERNPPDGVIYIIDMAGFGLMHVTKLRPDALKKYFEYLGDGLPMKFKAMHFLNANYFVDKLMSICSVLINPEVMNKVHMHQPGITKEDILKISPRKCLPQELGGDLGPEEELCKKTIELLKKKEKFWDTEESLRTTLYTPN